MMMVIRIVTVQTSSLETATMQIGHSVLSISKMQPMSVDDLQIFNPAYKAQIGCLFLKPAVSETDTKCVSLNTCEKLGIDSELWSQTCWKYKPRLTTEILHVCHSKSERQTHNIPSVFPQKKVNKKMENNTSAGQAEDKNQP